MNNTDKIGRYTTKIVKQTTYNFYINNQKIDFI